MRNKTVAQLGFSAADLHARVQCSISSLGRRTMRQT